jgi:hypothetical protein
LKPGWIVRWLQNPQLIQPGTKMPRFFRKGAFQDIFPGTPEEQIESIKDLLMNFPLDMLISKEPDKNVKNELRDSNEKSKKSNVPTASPASCLQQGSSGAVGNEA